jgi:hypothetical protein
MKGGEVDADLVSAAGVEAGFDESGVGDVEEGAPVRAGGAGAGEHDTAASGHAGAALGVAGNREIDAAVCLFEGALDEGDVGLFDLTLAKGFTEFGVGEIGFGDEDDAGSVFIEAMDDAGAEGVAALGEGLAAAEERVDQSAAGIASAGVDGHAGGLVDGDEVVIFVEDFEGDGFGLGARSGAGLRLEGDALAASEFLGGFRTAAVDENKASINQFLDAGAAEVGALRGDEAVQTRTGVGGGGEQFANWRSIRWIHADILAEYDLAEYDVTVSDAERKGRTSVQNRQR